MVRVRVIDYQLLTANSSLFTPLENTEISRFSHVFRWYKKGTPPSNGLRSQRPIIWIKPRTRNFFSTPNNAINHLELSIFMCNINVLNLPVLCIFKSCIEIKIKLHFYFHTSLWYLKKFSEGLKGLHKTFWGAAKKCENKNLTWFFPFVPDWDGKG